MPALVAPPIRLAASQRRALESHFLALDREDRRLRFGAALPDDAVRAYVARIDFARDGVFAVQDDDLAILAAVHVAVGGGSAELGLSVLGHARGRGLGRALFVRAVTYLRNRAIPEVFVHCLAENGAMMHLARSHGMRVAHEAGEADGRLRLPQATVDSFVSEWLGDQQAVALQAVRREALAARRAYDAWSQRPLRYSPSGK